MKKFKFTIAYSLDTITQFRHFEKSVSIFLKRNIESMDDFIVRIFISEENEETIESVKSLMLNFDSVNFELITKTKEIFKNTLANRNPMIWWVYFPWVINDSEYLVAIDNDTLPNIDINFVYDHAKGSLIKGEKIILQNKIGFSWNNGNTSKFNRKMISVQKNGKKVNSKMCGNGGFVVTDIEEYKKYFNSFYGAESFDDFRKMANKFIRRILTRMFTLYLSDEAFICYFLNDKISNTLKNILNYSQHEIENFVGPFESENLNIHFFIRDERNKKVLLYEYFDTNDEDLGIYKNNFKNAMLNFSRNNKDKFDENQIDEFLDFIFGKMESLKEHLK